MNVQIAQLHDGDCHIVFDDSHGIQIDEFEADFLRQQLRAWKNGEVYEFQEGESSLVFVDLPRDEDDTDRLHIGLGNVWYEVPVTVAMEILHGLENPVSEDDSEDVADSYDDVVQKYLRWAGSQRGIVNQPNRGLSEFADGKWYLANVRGPLATVDQVGRIGKPDLSDPNWE